MTDNGFYAWEWGSFHFISLGLWAFVDQGWDVGDDSYDEGKVGWLKEHLAAVGTEKAIVLFQKTVAKAAELKTTADEAEARIITKREDLINKVKAEKP